MKKLLVVLLIAAVAGTLVWGILRKNAPPEVHFTAVARQPLVSTLPTNGKVEPYQWQAVRTESTGLITNIEVHNGQQVAKGAVLAQLSDPEVRAAIDSAEARVAEVSANLALLETGGRSAEQTEIETSLDRARFNLQTEQKEYDALKRLVDKQAATPVELELAANKVKQTQLEIDALGKRRGSLVSKADVDATKARLRDAQSAVALAHQHAALTVVSSPASGEVYDLTVRAGGYLNPGDLVANVGTLDKLRVRVYVDEPLLGRVALGQPVTIKWEALPGKQWVGTVDQMPTSIQTLGSRQVGEVVCAIQNPGRDLIPGTNVDAEIRTATIDSAVVIPKEALRHDAAGDFVFTLHGETIERRAVKSGISSVTLTQITEGLQSSDSVAMPSDTPLKTGDHVKAIR